MSTSSGYWVTENGNTSDRDNVFYERRRTYSPVTKMFQVMDNSAPLSPRANPPSPVYQTVISPPEPQFQRVQHMQEVPSSQQETVRTYIIQNTEQEVQSPNPTATIRRYVVQNPELEVQSPYTQQETVRRYIVQNPELEVQSPYTQQETVRRYIVQNPEQEIPMPYTQQGTIRRYIVQNPEQEVQGPYQRETVRQYIVRNSEQETPVQQESVRRYIVQNPEQQTYLKGVNYIPSNNVIYEKTFRRVEKANSEVDKLSQNTRTMSVSSGTDQVHEQNIQTRTSVQSFEQEIAPAQEIQQKVSVNLNEQVSVNVDVGPEQLDARYFGELLAELSRKNSDLYNCLMQHVEKIGARKPSESDDQDIESLIPKGVSELTKQQIRYLLQMRQTSDKSMRLVLNTFNSLREELIHLQDDLNKLDTDKKSLERDLAFKDSQIKEYEAILASLREKNRQQQQELKDRTMMISRLEEKMLTLRNTENDKEYCLKELEYAKNALQQENQNLRLQLSETCSSPMLQTKADEISKQYLEMIGNLREEKDKEIRILRSQITKFQQEVVTREGSSSDFQMRLLELTSSLEEKESLIKRQQEELFRLRQERESKSVTKSVITKKT
ncbi:POF1B, actin binding protein S homeolog [Xenopus laevis]|uniref:POF1B, actin binding protein S homeolog n=1 Tax=Xenopus laevis TaxID=8355 RepID=B1H1Q8_XENLA|nr:POF1B, actin binding protein S homeolog [Xenopus laevis]AAI60701.1 Unknown (protein for MGC:179856) [Xenopus laevis]